MRKRMEQGVRRLRGLVEFCGDPFAGISMDGRLGFDWSVPGRDRARLTIDLGSMSFSVSSWMESHHNGDSYDERAEVLSQGEAEKALTKLLIRCEARALERAKKLIEEEERKKERRRVDEQARKRVRDFLGK